MVHEALMVWGLLALVVS